MKTIFYLIILLGLLAACSSATKESPEDAPMQELPVRDYLIVEILPPIVPAIEKPVPEVETEPEAPAPVFAYPFGALTPENVLSIANQRRLVVHEPDMALIESWIAAREAVTFDAARLFRAEGLAMLTAQQAAYDVAMFFQLLRHMYAGYHYFGGDDVLLPMRDSILAEIAARDAWSDTALTQLLQQRVGAVITDYHLVLGGYNARPFGNPHNTFVWDEPFDRSENGFRHRDTGRYVTHAENHDLYALFRLMVSESGVFYYAPVILRPARYGQEYALTLTFDDGETQTIPLRHTAPTRAVARGAANSLTFHDGIPILSMRRMGDTFNPHTTGHHAALLLLDYAALLREKSIIIIDIRSNEGGASSFTYQWLYALMDGVVPTNFNWLMFNDSQIYAADGVPRPPSRYRMGGGQAGLDFVYPPELFGKYLHMTPIGAGIYFTPEESRDGVVANDRLMILLIDRFTVSSGEIFADQFTNIENTLIIGQNTFGMLHTSGGMPLYLPYSGIIVGMGRHQLLHPAGMWTEGVGFAPDVWVNGCALTAALAIICEGVAAARG